MTESGGACGLSVFDDNQTILAVDIELLWLADLVVLYEPFDLEKPAEGVFEVGLALRVRVHLQDKVSWPNLAAWIQKKTSLKSGTVLPR